MSRIECKYCLISTSYLTGLFEIFNSFELQTPVDHAELRAPIFQIRAAFTRFISETKSVTPTFFGISDTSSALSDCSKNLKNIYRM